MGTQRSGNTHQHERDGCEDNVGFVESHVFQGGARARCCVVRVLGHWQEEGGPLYSIIILLPYTAYRYIRSSPTVFIHSSRYLLFERQG